MAIRNDFQCSAGHVEERVVKSGQRITRCHCGKRAEVVYLSRANRRACQSITPTVYYENAAGEVWSGPDAVTPCPLPGYIRKEVGSREIRAFTRRMNQKMIDEHKAQLERHSEASEFHAKHREEVRKELDAEILKESADWDSTHKQILEHAMTHRDDHVYHREYDPQWHIGAWE